MMPSAPCAKATSARGIRTARTIAESARGAQRFGPKDPAVSQGASGSVWRLDGLEIDRLDNSYPLLAYHAIQLPRVGACVQYSPRSKNRKTAIEPMPKNTETVTENWGISVSIRAFVPAAKSSENMKRPTIHRMKIVA